MIPTEVILDWMKDTNYANTYDGWKAKGFAVQKGEKASFKIDGVAYFKEHRCENVAAEYAGYAAYIDEMFY